MSNPQNWTAFQQRVDFIVDNTFSEPVVLIPWEAGTSVYTPVEQGPDPTRQLIVTSGIFVTPGAKLVGESGRATGGSGGGFGTQVLEQEVWLSITLANIGGDITAWVAGDRVYFPNRDRFYNISYVEDSATLRPNIHLIREHDIYTGKGTPLMTGIIPTEVNELYFSTLGYKFYRSVSGTGPPDINGDLTFTVNDWVSL
jgi:hypothetical protein